MKTNRKTLPKISVVTPSYNQGKFIEETIKSVISQNYPNLEYIIKDGGSSDASVKIIKTYAKKYPKVIKWTSKKDRGQADAINQGFKSATGDILTYINSDDTYLPGALVTVGDYFHKNPNAKWLTGDYEIVNEKGEKIQNYVVVYKRLLRMLSSLSILLVGNYIAQPSTFWRKEVTRSLGYLDEDQHLVLDYDYWLRIMNKYRLHVTPKSLSKFRIHSSSKGNNQYVRQFRESVKVAEKHTKSKTIIFLHRLHAWIIIFCYKLIK